MKKYSKGLVALSGVLVVLGHALTDGQIEANEVPELLIAVGVAFGVYRVPNTRP